MPINWIKQILTSKKEAEQLVSQIKSQNVRIQGLVKEFNNISTWNTQYVATLSMLTDAIQAMIWKKDRHNKYLLANPHHCRSFFGFDGTSDCLEYVVGKTDNELIHTMFTEKGVENTFAKVCCLSDEYVSEQTVPVHFLEAGKVDKDEILLYTVKTPQFTVDGEYIGTIGMAWDMTSRSQFLTNHLNRWIYSDMATKIYHEKDVFCYVIVPEANQCGIFNHVCPEPHQREDALDTKTKSCNVCEDSGGCYKPRESK